MKYPVYDGQETCERCHKAVDHDKAVWLELNLHTGVFCLPGTIDEEDSQGGFAFGPDCAKEVLNNPYWDYIGLAKRNRG